ncbi:MAG: SurA N-terminal domain-containing protein [Holosporales bacterium]|jgi:peptidyl-prolyl cis-trans isomerase D|nr:SurA N-terminal domain-containing protein [Holosporales bacterium]
MLKSLRSASHSLFIKILFGAIILSFCLWGVGDIFKNYSASRTVISVAKSKVSADTFIREYHSEKQRIRNDSKTPLTNEEMRKIDVKGIVVDNIVNRLVFEQSIGRLGILVPKKSIIGLIQALPDFQVDGVFSERVYENVLKRSGIGEAGFLAQIKNNLEQMQLFHPINTSYRIPAFIKEQIAKEFEAEKTLLVLKLSPNDMKVEQNPSNDEVKQYFEINKDQYEIPERRDLSVLIIDYQALAGDALEIDPAEVESRFQQTKHLFIQPETRDFERFSFERKEDADKAWNMLNSGASSNVVKKKFAIQADIVRGIRLSDLPEQFGKDLFELTLNKTSSVCSSGGQFYIYRLIKVNTSKMQDENEIKLKIKEEIRNERLNAPEFYGKIKAIKNKIDDGFGSGKSIDEIAKETGLKVIELKSFAKDSQEMTKIVKDEAARNEMIQASFDIGENQATQIIESKEDDSVSYVAYVRKIEKSEVPQLEKIIGKVKDDYITRNKEKEAEKMARDITNNGDEAATDVKKRKGVRVYKLSKKDLIMAVQRNEMKGDVTKILLDIPNPDILFNVMSTTRKGEAVSYKLPDGGQIVVAIQDVSVGVSASDEMRKIFSNHVDAGASRDIMAVAMNAMKQPLDIEINKDVIGELIQSSDKADENG